MVATVPRRDSRGGSVTQNITDPKTTPANRVSARRASRQSHRDNIIAVVFLVQQHPLGKTERTRVTEAVKVACKEIRRERKRKKKRKKKKKKGK